MPELTQPNVRLPSATLPVGFMLDPPRAQPSATLPPGFVLDPAPPHSAAQDFTYVRAPDGTLARFPAGMSDDEITAVMRREYGGPGSPPAEKPRTIQFEGRTVQVPADFSDGEVRHVLSQAEGSVAPTRLKPVTDPETLRQLEAAPGLKPVTDPEILRQLEAPANFADRFSPAIAQPLKSMPQSPAPAADRPITAGVQGAGRAIADTIGLAPDIANMGANALLAGADFVSSRFGGPRIGYRFPMLSDEFANTASHAATAAGVPVLDPAKMSERERLAYNMNRFGGQAALTAGALAPVAAARAAEGAARVPKVGDAFLRAYEAAPAAVALGDTAAGAGAGAGLTAAQSVPESVRSSYSGAPGLMLDLAGMAGGQIGASTITGLATRGPGYLKNRITAGMPARDIPLDPETRMPVSNTAANEAAQFVQSQSVDPQAAAASIKSGANEYRKMGAPMPTSGALSNDPKLMALERGSRRLAPAEFAPRDMALRDAAVDTVEGIQPQNVNPRAATDFIRSEADRQIGTAASALQNSQRALTKAEAGERSIADVLRAYSGRGGDASASLDRAITAGGLVPAQRQKNALYEAIDPERTVMRSADPLVNLATEIEKQVAEIPPALQREMVPQQLISDVKSMSGGQISFGAMNDMRMGLASASLAARKAGQYRLAENLDSFRSLIGREGEALAAEGGPAGERARAANEYYRNEFAPVWNRGPGDEAARFRKDFNTDQINRTTTPPTATAGRFLGTTPGAREKAESLSRVIGSLPNPQDQQAAGEAVRQYVMNDLIWTIGNDGKIDPQQLARWLNGPSGWREALQPFPAVQSEVQKLFTDVKAGNAQRNALAAQVERASAGLQRTKEDVANSALSLVIGREPVKAARAVLESKDPQMAMREIRRTIGGNKTVQPAWERAVTDHLVDKITNVDPAGVSSGERSINYGKLVKTLDRYDGALAELYAGEPEKMQALQRARKLLEPLARQSGPATTAVPTGPNTADLWKLLEVGLKAHFGILKGGGVLRTLKVAASLTHDEAADAQRLVTRMWFDPELAQHLLTRDVQDVGSPAWNAKLGKLLRRVEVGREVLGNE